MSARFIFFWSCAVFFAYSGAMMLVQSDDHVSTLEGGLGPSVVTETLSSS
jgi:hypothetical protein